MTKDQEFRRALLGQSRGDIERVLARAARNGCEDPWVLIVDLNDQQGRQVAIFAEAVTHGPDGAEDRVREMIESRPGNYTAVSCIAVPAAGVGKLLANTSPTAEASVRSINAHREAHPKAQPVVVVAAGGNTYALAELDT
jgi:hypothetical protein